MKVNGSATLHHPRPRVWAALQDPQVLVATIPGVSSLEAVGDDAYRMILTAGVASIKGSYVGEVRLSDPAPPEAYTLRATGSGAPGTVEATARITLAELDGSTTRVEYDAEAVVGGMMGGVGQRVLAGVAKKTAGEFFGAVDRYLAAPPVPAQAAPVGEGEEPLPVPPAPPVPTPAVAPPRRFAAPPRATAGRPPVGDLLAAGLVGAAIALLGVAVGARLGRRS